MNTKQIHLLVGKIEKLKTTIATKRDELRETVEELTDLLDCLDEGISCLNEGIDKISEYI